MKLVRGMRIEEPEKSPSMWPQSSAAKIASRQMEGERSRTASGRMVQGLGGAMQFAAREAQPEPGAVSRGQQAEQAAELDCVRNAGPVGRDQEDHADGCDAATEPTQHRGEAEHATSLLLLLREGAQGRLRFGIEQALFAGGLEEGVELFEEGRHAVP
ncbi:MAG: hypothetical protein ABIP94_13940 [Planctomycetota bacterium]